LALLEQSVVRSDQPTCGCSQRILHVTDGHCWTRAEGSHRSPRLGEIAMRNTLSVRFVTAEIGSAWQIEKDSLDVVWQDHFELLLVLSRNLACQE
jgi:hypothetical protein